MRPRLRLKCVETTLGRRLSTTLPPLVAQEKQKPNPLPDHDQKWLESADATWKMIQAAWGQPPLNTKSKPEKTPKKVYSPDELPTEGVLLVNHLNEANPSESVAWGWYKGVLKKDCGQALPLETLYKLASIIKAAPPNIAKPTNQQIVHLGQLYDQKIASIRRQVHKQGGNMAQPDLTRAIMEEYTSIGYAPGLVEIAHSLQNYDQNLLFTQTLETTQKWLNSLPDQEKPFQPILRQLISLFDSLDFHKLNPKLVFQLCKILFETGFTKKFETTMETVYGYQFGAPGVIFANEDGSLFFPIEQEQVSLILKRHRKNKEVQSMTAALEVFDTPLVLTEPFFSSNQDLEEKPMIVAESKVEPEHYVQMLKALAENRKRTLSAHYLSEYDRRAREDLSSRVETFARAARGEITDLEPFRHATLQDWTISPEFIVRLLNSYKNKHCRSTKLTHLLYDISIQRVESVQDALRALNQSFEELDKSSIPFQREFLSLLETQRLILQDELVNLTSILPKLEAELGVHQARTKVDGIKSEYNRAGRVMQTAQKSQEVRLASSMYYSQLFKLRRSQLEYYEARMKRLKTFPSVLEKHLEWYTRFLESYKYKVITELRLDTEAAEKAKAKIQKS